MIKKTKFSSKEVFDPTKHSLKGDSESIKFSLKGIVLLLNSPFLLFSKVRDRYLFTFGAILFYIIFLMLFTPYDIKYWLHDVSPVKTMAIPFIGVISGLLMQLSHYIQSRYFANKSMKIYHLIAGFSFDVLFLALCISCFYSTHDSSILNDFVETITLILPIITIWYVIGLSFLKIVTSNRITAERQKILFENQNTQNLINDSIIKLMDENNNLIFSITTSHLLFIESADNYVVVHYIENQIHMKKMIRNSLKKMEEELSFFQCVRCHRSYIVNLNKVVNLKKTNNIYTLVIAESLILIPISRSYIKTVKELLLKNQKITS